MPDGARPQESADPVGGTTEEEARTFLKPDHLGAVGSYASFFGCLLIATILAFDEIFRAIYDLLQKRISDGYVDLVVLVLLTVFAVLFVVFPSIPVVVDIRAHLRRGDRRTGLLLIFLTLIYDFALCAQMVSSYADRFGR